MAQKSFKVLNYTVFGDFKVKTLPGLGGGLVGPRYQTSFNNFKNNNASNCRLYHNY